VTTTIASTSIVVAEPVLSDAEQFALAGFLAGYRGLTRDAYALDLRQFVAWCEQHDLPLFDARRAGIECFARDLEERGRARATVGRRLSTVAGFYRYAEEEGLLAHSPAAHVRRPRLDYESHATGWIATRSAPCWWPPDWAGRPSMPWCRCWRSTGCGSSKRWALTSKRSASSAAIGP
jgi:hypothetical protein